MITIFNMAIDELTDWLTNNIMTFRSALQTTRRHGHNVTRLWMPGYIGQADNDNSAELISVDSGWGIVFQQIFTFRSILSYFLDILWPQKNYTKYLKRWLIISNFPEKNWAIELNQKIILIKCSSVIDSQEPLSILALKVIDSNETLYGLCQVINSEKSSERLLKSHWSSVAQSVLDSAKSHWAWVWLI